MSRTGESLKSGNERFTIFILWFQTGIRSGKLMTTMKHFTPILAFPLLFISSCTPEKNIDSEETGASKKETLAERKYAESKAIYGSFCASCHDSGLAGAPKPGDSAEWDKRMAPGLDAIVKKSIDGYDGKKGTMPPKGGNENLTEKEVREAVSYMSGLLKPE